MPVGRLHHRARARARRAKRREGGSDAGAPLASPPLLASPRSVLPLPAAGDWEPGTIAAIGKQPFIAASANPGEMVHFAFRSIRQKGGEKPRVAVGDQIEFVRVRDRPAGRSPKARSVRLIGDSDSDDGDDGDDDECSGCESLPRLLSPARSDLDLASAVSGTPLHESVGYSESSSANAGGGGGAHGRRASAPDTGVGAGRTARGRRGGAAARDARGGAPMRQPRPPQQQQLSPSASPAFYIPPSRRQVFYDSVSAGSSHHSPHTTASEPSLFPGAEAHQLPDPAILLPRVPPAAPTLSTPPAAVPIGTFVPVAKPVAKAVPLSGYTPPGPVPSTDPTAGAAQQRWMEQHGSAGGRRSTAWSRRERWEAAQHSMEQAAQPVPMRVTPPLVGALPLFLSPPLTPPLLSPQQLQPALRFP